MQGFPFFVRNPDGLPIVGQAPKIIGCPAARPVSLVGTPALAPAIGVSGPKSFSRLPAQVSPMTGPDVLVALTGSSLESTTKIAANAGRSMGKPLTGPERASTIRPWTALPDPNAAVGMAGAFPSTVSRVFNVGPGGPPVISLPIMPRIESAWRRFWRGF